MFPGNAIFRNQFLYKMLFLILSIEAVSKQKVPCLGLAGSCSVFGFSSVTSDSSYSVHVRNGRCTMCFGSDI
jgi:hypothetical protein